MRDIPPPQMLSSHDPPPNNNEIRTPMPMGLAENLGGGMSWSVAAVHGPPSSEQLLDRLPVSNGLSISSMVATELPTSTAGDETFCIDTEAERAGIPQGARVGSLIDRFMKYYNSTFTVLSVQSVQEMVHRFTTAPKVTQLDAFMVNSE